MRNCCCKRLRACAIGSLLAQTLLPAASSVPSGGTFVAGSGSILASANTLTINQSSTRGVVNWNSFSIGAGGVVNFNNGSGATLNRVTGGNMSTILGQLLATGSVYILNPHGVLIGPGGTIKTTGDFVATPLQISNAAFMKGGALLFEGNSNAMVKNLGAISSTGGSVFLLANAVDNEGSVAAANGSVGLAAGHTVLLKDSSSDQRVFVETAGGDITNSGSLTAAEVEVRASGGNIYALAGNNGGVIRAKGTGTRNGQVWLVADGGTLSLSGSVFAENSDGTGGAIETSGHSVSMSGAKVSTGTGGSWLVDPVDLNIDASAALSIVNALNDGTNVTEQTTASGSSGFGNTSAGNGDINVNSPISWSTGASLTLSAYNNINVNQAITNTGAGNIILRADNTGTGAGSVALNAATTTTSGAISIYYNPPAGGSGKYNNAQTFTNATAGGGVTAYMLVNNVTDLESIGANGTTLGGTYAMGANIDAGSVANFVPIGYFTGVFDGNGQLISNLNIQSSAYNTALFGTLGAGAILRHVGVINANVQSTGNTTAILVGENEGSISSSFASGSVNAQSELAAGLAGVNGPSGSITNCYSQGVVSGGSVFEAGLVGFNYLGAISSSYSTVIASNGLVAVGAGGSVTDSYWDMTNSGTTISSGGGTGLTRTQLQNTAQAGFSPTVWGNATGGYPYLQWQFPDGAPATFSGVAYTDQSHSANNTFYGSPVKGILNGASIGQTVYTGADGYYSFEVNPSQVTNGGSMVTYLSSGAGLSFWDNTNAAPYYTMPITAGYITLRSTVPSSTTALNDLAIALNGAAPMTAPLQGYDFIGYDSAINIDTSTNFSGLNLVFENFASVTQSVGISPTDLSLLNNDSVVLTNANNAIGTLAAGVTRKIVVPPSLQNGPRSNLVHPNGPAAASGTLAVFNSTDLHLGTTDAAQGVYVIDATIQSAGALIIDSSNTVKTTGSGISLVLADGTTFTNNSGSSAVAAPNGNWEVWSQNPGNDNRAGEAYDFKQYNATYGESAPAQSTGNAFFYTMAPVITATLSPITKQYDGSTTATNLASATYSEISAGVDGDTILVGAATTGSYGSKNVGSGIPVTVSGIGISATNGAANVYGYQVTASGSGSITPAPVTAVTSAGNKVYDGTTTASGSATVAGLFGSDSVSVTGGSYNFSDKNAGTGKTVTATGLTLTGSDAGNYVLNTIDTTTANITPATLTLPFTPANKVYDSTVAAAASLGNLMGVIGDDQVTLAGSGQFSFSDKNVGTGKTVSGSGFTLTGTDAGNYTVVATGTQTASITPAPLTLVFSANNKVYDGTTSATATITGLTGVLSQDSVSLVSGTPAFTFANANAGSGKTVSGTGGQLTGADAGNYIVVYSQTGTTSITPATLYYTAQVTSRPSGLFNPPLTGSVTGFVGGDTLASATSGTAVFTTSASPASPVGLYPIVGSGLTVPSGNYVLAQAPGNMFAFAVVANNPALATIPSFSNAPMETPAPLPLPAIAPLVGPNTSGFFQIGYSAAFDWIGFLSCSGLLHENALASSSSFLVTQTSETPTSDYAAGVHP